MKERTALVAAQHKKKHNRAIEETNISHSADATMARAKRSQSDLIRATFAELGANARNRDVIDKLAERKVMVRAQMVSVVRKRMDAGTGSNGRPGPGRPRRASLDGTVSLRALLAAKTLVTESGSIEAAKTTLEALGRLQ